MDTTPFPSIRLLVLDVDGTLTDGAVYMGPNGEAMKAFSAQDGLGLQMMAAAAARRRMSPRWRCSSRRTFRRMSAGRSSTAAER